MTEDDKAATVVGGAVMVDSRAATVEGEVATGFADVLRQLHGGEGLVHMEERDAATRRNLLQVQARRQWPPQRSGPAAKHCDSVATSTVGLLRVDLRSASASVMFLFCREGERVGRKTQGEI